MLTRENRKTKGHTESETLAMVFVTFQPKTQAAHLLDPTFHLETKGDITDNMANENLISTQV
jgi:hypothetical protein